MTIWLDDDTAWVPVKAFPNPYLMIPRKSLTETRCHLGFGDKAGEHVKKTKSTDTAAISWQWSLRVL